MRYFDFSDYKLQRVQNGLGNVASFDYTSMSKVTSLNSSYGSQYNANNIYVQLPMQLVSRFRDGNGGIDVNYKYSGAMLNKKGRGFMGFRRLEAIDNINNESTFTYLNKYNTFSNYLDAFVVDYVEKIKNGTILESNRSYFTPILTSGGYTWNINNAGRLWLKQYKTEESSYFSGNVTTNLVYDDYGNITNKEVIDADGYKVNESFVYGTNANKRPALPNSSTTTYSKTGLISNSYTTTYEYTALYQLKKKIEFSGLPKALTTEYLYNSYGNFIEDKMTANGLATRKTEYVYNPSNDKFLSEKKNSLGQSTLYFMDTRFNKPTSTTGVDGRNMYYSSDPFGTLKDEYTYHSNGSPIVNTTNYIWDNSMSIDNKNSVYKVKTYSTNSPVNETYYDMAGRKIAEKNQVFDGTYQLTKYFYNIKNKVYRTQLFDANNQLVKGEDIVYDDYGRIIMRDYLDANGSFHNLENTTYTKGSDFWEVTNSIPASSSNSNGTTRYTKTSLGGKTLESNENGVNALTYEYNAQGKPRKVISSGIVLNEKEYDIYGRINKEIDNSAGTEIFDYNAFGEIISQNTSNNGFKKFEYDVLGRKTKEIINEGTITYTYFPTGSGIKTNLIKEIKGYNNINKEVYDYDIDGRMSTITKTIAGSPALTKTITLTHNLIGQLSQKSITGGGTYNYWYNSLGFLHEITKGSQQVYALLAVSPVGTPKDLKLGGTRNVSYQYDNLYRVTNIASDFVNDNYTWDNINGNLESKMEINSNSFPTVNPMSYSYVYDNFNRLTEEHLDMWGRPRVSNNLQYESNGRIEYNEKASKSNEPYAYHSGKMFAVKNIFLTEPHFSPYSQNLVFSSFNRPTKITQQNHELTYVYDHSFDRVFANQRLNGSTQFKRYYFGSTEFNYDASNNLINSIDYIYAGDQLVAMDVIRPNGSDIWYVHEDYQGTIRAVYNSSNQVYYQNFDAWGNYRTNDVLSPNYGQISYQKPISIPNWLYKGYTGQEHLAEFGLINLNARLYDPHIGRMLSPDILVTDNSLQGYNRYSYCHNNPLKFCDPDGNDPVILAFAIGAGLGLFTKAAINLMEGRNLLAGDAKSWITAGLVGGVSGVMTMGIGSSLGGVGAGAGTALGKVGTEIARAGAHGLVQGMLAPVSGGEFLSGFASGSIASALGSGTMMYGGNFGNSKLGGFGVSALGGGIGAELTGGNFLEGARNGIVIHALNHLDILFVKLYDVYVNYNGMGGLGMGHHDIAFQKGKDNYTMYGKQGAENGNPCSGDGSPGFVPNLTHSELKSMLSSGSYRLKATKTQINNGVAYAEANYKGYYSAPFSNCSQFVMNSLAHTFGNAASVWASGFVRTASPRINHNILIPLLYGSKIVETIK
ncbi:MAG: RHS repeat domain-containing protein [Chitinophagales bacterium]